MKNHSLRVALLLAALMLCGISGAKTADMNKLSPLVRKAVLQSQTSRFHKSLNHDNRRLTAFVRAEGGAATLEDEGCDVLASFGNIHIASIPLTRLASLSLSDRVTRIEASERCSVNLDSIAIQVGAVPVYAGQNLPQAYTGKGVVMGVEDIGFDLTHPTYYSRDLSDYRIKAFWDQLSVDTVGSKLYVGRDFTTREEMLAVGCARDGKTQTHGTHTSAIAAGSGYTSPYRGLAWESDICLVCNATGNDYDLISDEDQYKYSNATDALGFKYIFDYARAQGKPCVLSFSEGYHPRLNGDDELYYAVIDSLVGPGRILVASAGNEGLYKSYFVKPVGTETMGGFLRSSDSECACLLRSSDFFDLRLVAYAETNDTLIIPSRWAFEAADSLYTKTVQLSNGVELVVQLTGYPACYGEGSQAYELVVSTPAQSIGVFTPISMEVMGSDAEVEWFRDAGYLATNSLNNNLNAGEPGHNIHAPAASPSVICVGASSYRTRYVNYKGSVRALDMGTGGQIARYSSTGPTLDGRTKPDVVAPGTNIISAYNSYYLENLEDEDDMRNDVQHFDFNGRTYSWSANSGTSMSTPAAAGVIALWLQANPQLTPEDVLDIIAKTSSHYDESLTYPNNTYGYGQIEAYEGLVEVLKLPTAIPSISRHQPRDVRFVLQGETLLLNTDNPVAVRVYSTSGQLLRSEEHTRAVDLTALPHGVLVIQVTGTDAATTGSTLIRH